MNSKKPDFIDLYRPRHFHSEAFSEAAKGNLKLMEVFTSTADTTRNRKSLLELYMPDGIHEIIQDALKRPDHYTTRQHEIIRLLNDPKKSNPSVTDEEKTELLLTLQRDTELEQHSRELLKPVAKNPVLKTEEACFENQDFGDKVII